MSDAHTIQEVTDSAAIQELDENEENRFVFSLNEIEQRTFKDWAAEHDGACKIRDTDTADGGRFSFEFFKGTLGDPCIAKCVCGATKNVTDYSCW